MWHLTMKFCQVTKWHCICSYIILDLPCEVLSWLVGYIIKLVFLKKDYLSVWGDSIAGISWRLVELAHLDTVKYSLEKKIGKK